MDREEEKEKEDEQDEQPLESARSYYSSVQSTPAQTPRDVAPSASATPRTLALYKLRHTRLASAPVTPPLPSAAPPTAEQLDRARVLEAREGLLAERREWWAQRWAGLQQSLAARIEASEVDAKHEAAKQATAQRCTQEKEASHQRRAALIAQRNSDHRVRATIEESRRVECRALEYEAQQQLVFEHYCYSRLVSHYSAVQARFRVEIVEELEDRELQLRESLRLTERTRIQQDQRARREQALQREQAARQQEKQRSEQRAAQEQEAKRQAMMDQHTRIVQQRAGGGGGKRRSR